MNCDWVQQNVSLYLYNELADTFEPTFLRIDEAAVGPRFDRSSSASLRR